MESTLLLIYVVFISYSNLFLKKDFFFIEIIFSIKRTPLGLLELIISNKRFFFHCKRLKDFLVLFFSYLNNL